MSFYLTLPSNGDISQKEYPKNTNNSWKIRLPKPINLIGKWMVGLSSISYPADSRMDEFLKTLKDDTILLRSTRILKKSNGDYELKYMTVEYGTIKDKEIVSIKDLFLAMFKEEWLRFVILLSPDENPTLKLSDGSLANYQWQLKEENDSITVDTSTLYDSDWQMVKQINLDFNEDLLRRFGFVEDQHIINGSQNFTTLKPGINMKVAFRSNVDGWSEDVSKRQSEDWYYGIQKLDSASFPGGGVRFRMDLKWTFLNLKDQSHQKGSESRSLYVYSSLCEPQMMGSDTADLLRQVIYNPSLKGGYLYEPHNIQYVGLRQNRIEVIETEIGEVDENSLAKFHKGNTTVTVHFKRVP